MFVGIKYLNYTENCCIAKIILLQNHKGLFVMSIKVLKNVAVGNNMGIPFMATNI